ncbi:MAG TPA: SPOR domain-containing protein [Burkholderiaceae bacterium]
MLKFLFWVLLLSNAALFAYGKGYSLLPEEHEPDHMARQINPESVKLVPASLVEAKSGTASAGAAAAAKAEPASCSEFGSFDQATAKRLDGELQPLALGSRLTRREVEDAAHNIVYIPPQGNKDGAEKKATELRHLGVSDFYIIQDGDLRWGISLGVFKTEEAARAQLAALSQKGVHSARLGTRNVTSTKVFYQVRDLDAAGKTALEKVLADFPHADKHACEGATDAKAPDVKAAAASKASYPRDAIH